MLSRRTLTYGNNVGIRPAVLTQGLSATNHHYLHCYIVFSSSSNFKGCSFLSKPCRNRTSTPPPMLGKCSTSYTRPLIPSTPMPACTIPA